MNSRKIISILTIFAIFIIANLFTNKTYATECIKINDNEIKYFDTKLNLTKDNGKKINKNVEFPFHKDNVNIYTFDSDKYHLKYDNSEKLGLYTTDKDWFYTEDENNQIYEENGSIEYVIKIPFILAENIDQTMHDGTSINECFEFTTDADFSVSVDGSKLFITNPVGQTNSYKLDFKRNYLYKNNKEYVLLDSPLTNGNLYNLTIKITNKKDAHYKLNMKFDLWLTGIYEKYYDARTNNQLGYNARNCQAGDKVEPRYKTFENYKFNNCDANVDSNNKITIKDGINYATHYYDKIWNGEINYLDYENNNVISEASYFKSCVENEISDSKKNIDNYTFYNEKKEYDDGNDYLKIIYYYKPNISDEEKDKSQNDTNEQEKTNSENNTNEEEIDSKNAQTKENDGDKDENKNKDATNKESNNQDDEEDKSNENNFSNESNDESKANNKNNVNENNNKDAIEKEEMNENKTLDTNDDANKTNIGSKINKEIEKIKYNTKEKNIELPNVETIENPIIETIETPKVKKAYSFENLIIQPKKISKNNENSEDNIKSEDEVLKNDELNNIESLNEITEDENQAEDSNENANKDSDKIESTENITLSKALTKLENQIKKLKFKLKIWITVAFINLFITIFLILNKLKKI